MSRLALAAGAALVLLAACATPPATEAGRAATSP
jgi:uncharacterized lipoprotein YajG